MVGKNIKSRIALIAFVSLNLLHSQFVEASDVEFLRSHCLQCHDASTASGNLNLEGLPNTVSAWDNFATWVKIHDRVAAGEMPPPSETQPSSSEKRKFLQALDERLQQADTVRQQERGRVPIRRLTRQEFQNSLIDLLALPRLDIISLLPADGRVSGYHKIGSALDLSSSHLVAYQEAVEKALDLSIATRSTPPPLIKHRVYPASLFKFGGNLIEGQYVLLRDKAPDPALPVRGGFEEKQGHVGSDGPDLESRRKLLEEVKASRNQSAVGLLNPNLAGYEAAMNVAPIYAGNYRMRISLWGFQWNQGKPVACNAPQATALRAHAEGKQEEGGRLLRLLTAPSMKSNEVEFTAWIDPLESIVFDPVSIPWNGLRIGQVAGRASKHQGPGVAIDWFEIEGPICDSWPPLSHQALFGKLPIKPLSPGGDAVPPKRRGVRGLGGYLPNFFTDIPASERKPVLESVQSDEPLIDAKELLAGFLPRAFRRDVTLQEIEPYLRLLQLRLNEHDSFEDAMRRVYGAILTSPEFLFVAGDRPDQSELFSKNQQYALASRLSYWLVNGPPDQELLDRARQRVLYKPEVLRSQVERLLADPRSERFIDDFANQWLELSRLDETTPDPKLYPEYRFLLHEGIADEPKAFLRELIDHDLPITSLLHPGFAMLSQRLAEHYGIGGVEGVHIRRVELNGKDLRGGLLGQAAIHKLTANGTTTSPIKRGLWVMDRLLNNPAPPPPPGISAIDPDTRGATTIREQLDKHRANESCAVCHQKIDPAGFALEAFDPIGGLRTHYRSNGAGDVPPEKGHAPWRVEYRMGPSVDPSGQLADGRSFTGPAELVDLLNANPEALATAFVAHLSRYATGSEISYCDRAEMRRIVAATKAQHYGLKSLIHAFAQSPLFLSMKADNR
jgi:hypothetical protein